MNLISISNSRFGPSIGMALTRLLPARAIYRLAERIAARTAELSESDTIRNLRVNQAVLRGLPIDHPDLNEHVRTVLRNAARGYVTLYRAMARGLDAMLEAGPFSPNLLEGFQSALDAGKGLIVAGTHMGSFDIFLMTLTGRGLPVQALSIRDPQGSHRMQNQMRRRYGLEIAPVSMPSLRRAVKHLRNGKMVLTGVDLPAPEGMELMFMGRPTLLPVGHAKLSVLTGAPIYVIACPSLDEFRYMARGEGPIVPEITGDTKQDVRRLAQRVIEILEGYIRRWPDEWLMFFPLWPELASGVGK